MNPRRPSKAFVLAAGLGTRMLPLSRDLPKPLMPLWGKPVLQHTLELLRRWGVKDVVINLHHLPGEILEFVRHNPVPGLRISLSHEPDILGTGGALRRAAWFLGDAPFWLINADIALDLKPDALVKKFAGGRYLAAVWLDEMRGPRTVEMKRGCVTSFESRRPGRAGTYTFCGLHLLSPRILDFLPAEGFAGIIPAYELAMKRGERIAGVCVPGSFWADLGTPEQYLEAHRRKGERAWIGSNVTIERGARVVDSVIWDGAHLAARARVRHAIVGRDTRVEGLEDYIAMRADRALDAQEAAALETCGWPMEHLTACPLGARGSARTFTRIRRGLRSIILMRYSLERAENGLYCAHARFLDRLGLRVPKVLLDRPVDRLALLEDLGATSLEDEVRRRPVQQVRQLYRRVLDQVLLLHGAGARAARRSPRRSPGRSLGSKLPLMPPFSADLYRWERDFFARQFLELHLHRPAGEIRGIRRDLACVAARLLRARPVLIHRDLQSSNILLPGGRPAFVDFQGMRMGAAAYDLASLLCDPYAGLAPHLQEELLEYYAARADDGAAARRLFWWAAIERLAQALGAYARLSRLPGMQSFRRHMPTALATLRRALGRVPGLPCLRRWADALAAPGNAIDTP
ncbi:MAG: sugar phosphate nucleotidyltransferase [Verrucomicrobiota bacterium]